MIINDKKVDIVFGETILTAAKRAGIFIPTLCSDDSFLDWGGTCRLCIVEVTQLGKKSIVSACETTAIDDMIVRTDTVELQFARETILQLLYAEAPGSAAIKNMMEKMDIAPDPAMPMKNDSECILCGRCIKGCDFWLKGAIGFRGRGVSRKVDTPNGEPSEECLGCATCQLICPTDAIDCQDTDGTRRIWHDEHRLLFCEQCGKLLTTEETYFEGNYTGAPCLCHECSEVFRKEHRGENEFFDY